jgi:uncharacterized membrane protein YhaH (DUF805 family)
MTDDGKRRTGFFHFLNYRIGRPMYWLCIALLVAASLGIGIFTKSNASSGFAFVWVMLYAWRLHDLGRSGWWGVGAVGAMLALMAVALVIGLQLFGPDDPRFEPTASIGMVVAGLLQLGFTVWLGCARGDEGPNRFGERTTLRVGRRTI